MLPVDVLFILALEYQCHICCIKKENFAILHTVHSQPE